jgi:hypothetical protein
LHFAVQHFYWAFEANTMSGPAVVACISVEGVVSVGRNSAAINLPQETRLMRDEQLSASKMSSELQKTRDFPRDAWFALILYVSLARETAQIAYSFGTNMAKGHRDRELKHGAVVRLFGS